MESSCRNRVDKEFASHTNAATGAVEKRQRLEEAVNGSEDCLELV